MDNSFYNLCIIFGTCEVRRLNEMSNQSRIFDCSSGRFGKVVFNLKLANLIDSEVASHILKLTDNSRIKLGTCEIGRLNWT